MDEATYQQALQDHPKLLTRPDLLVFDHQASRDFKLEDGRETLDVVDVDAITVQVEPEEAENEVFDNEPEEVKPDEAENVVFDHEPESREPEGYVTCKSRQVENEHDTIEDHMSGKKEDMKPTPTTHF